MNTTSPRLKSSPAWEAAGQRLVSALASQPDEEARVRLLERVLAEFGDLLYPAFIQLLCAIDAFGDATARRVVADTFARALSTGRLPAGRMPAWGATGWTPAPPFGGAAPAMPRPSASMRSLGPIEFLSAWMLQPGSGGPLANADFSYAMTRLLHLFDASDTAARLYCARLRDEAENALEGAFSRQTRALLEAIAARWARHDPVEGIVAGALGSVQPESTFGAPAWRPSTAGAG